MMNSSRCENVTVRHRQAAPRRDAGLWVVASLAVLLLSRIAVAEDWPQFLGPSRNASYEGKAALADQWPATGPPVLWKKKVGEGFSSPVIAGEKLILFHRVEDRNILDCLRRDTGERLWTAGYDTLYADEMHKGNGPRSTPAIADGRVYAFGPDGVLLCVDLESGKELWQVNTRKQFKSAQGFFGRACSPVVDDGLVLLNIGGPQAGIGAFDAKTGALKWQATDHEAGYASPVVATISNTRYAFFFTRTGLVAVNPANGDVYFQHHWRSRQHASVNAASPLVIGDQVFLSSSYQTGALLLAVDDKQPRTIWSGDDILSSQYANVVHKDGYLYGFHGRNDFGDTRLRCVDLKTGKVKWTHDELPAGPILVAGDKLIVLLESGRLMLIAARPDDFVALASAQVLASPTRAHPALADGMLYARDGEQVICIDLRRKN